MHFRVSSSFTSPLPSFGPVVKVGTCKSFDIISHPHAASRLQAEHVPKLYIGLSLVVAVVWAWYNIAFALSNGTGLVKWVTCCFKKSDIICILFSLDIEIIIYVVLDIVVKSVVGFLLVFAHHTHNDNHTGTLPDYLVEPRAFRRIRLPVRAPRVPSNTLLWPLISKYSIGRRFGLVEKALVAFF